MGDKLPVELITTNASSIDRLHDGCRDDIERVIWQHFKVFSAHSGSIADGVGYRMENFFWRILSSPRIMRNIGKDQILRQFMSINEGFGIRTTPKASPRASRSFFVSQPNEKAMAMGTRKKPASLVIRDVASEKLLSSKQILVDEESRATRKTNTRYGRYSDAKDQEEGAPTPTPSSPFRHLRTLGHSPSGCQSCSAPKRVPIMEQDSAEEYAKKTKGRDPSVKAVTQELALSSNESEGHLLPEGESAAGNLEGQAKNVQTKDSEEGPIPRSNMRLSARRTSHGRPLEDIAQKLSRKSVSVVSTGAKRRKPPAMRHRSSQSCQQRLVLIPPSPVSQISENNQSSIGTANLIDSEQAGKAEGNDGQSPNLSSTKSGPVAPSSMSTTGHRYDVKAPSDQVTILERPVITRSPIPSFTNRFGGITKSSAVSAAASSYQAPAILDWTRSSTRKRASNSDSASPEASVTISSSLRKVVSAKTQPERDTRR